MKRSIVAALAVATSDVLVWDALCPAKPARHEPKPAPVFTNADAERLAKAEAKRQRKEAKRALTTKEPQK